MQFSWWRASSDLVLIFILCCIYRQCSSKRKTKSLVSFASNLNFGLVIPAKAKTKYMLIHTRIQFWNSPTVQSSSFHPSQSSRRHNNILKFIYCDYITAVYHFVAIAEYTHVHSPYVFFPFWCIATFYIFLCVKSRSKPCNECTYIPGQCI